MSIGLIGLLDDVAGIAKVAQPPSMMWRPGRQGGRQGGGRRDRRYRRYARLRDRIRAEARASHRGQDRRGSLRNKLLILLPAALVLSYFLPWTVTPLLMLGGAYLCYEGVEKVLEAVMPHHAHQHEAQLGTVALNARSVEDEKVASAIKTDFILSAEIMAITLAALPQGASGRRRLCWRSWQSESPSPCMAWWR